MEFKYISLISDGCQYTEFAEVCYIASMARVRRRSAVTLTAGDAPATPLTEAAYQAIKEEILANRLRPGDPVEAERFVHELNLSRTPVREALLRLKREGFVEIHPRMGTFVCHLDLRQIQEMYQVRRALEGLAARQSVSFLDMQRLTALENELKGYSTGLGADLKAISTSGQKVHELIVSCCENRVLASMIASLHDHFRRFRSFSLQIREKVLASHEEHLKILAALKNGDGEEAERLVHAHFDHAGSTLLESLLRPRPTGDGPRITIGSR
jgi:DNA-binding GntR family transcriptional regulator